MQARVNLRARVICARKSVSETSRAEIPCCPPPRAQLWASRDVAEGITSQTPDECSRLGHSCLLWFEIYPRRLG